MNDPTAFSRTFAAAFGAQDTAGIAALFTKDGTLHSLTGQLAEGRVALEACLADEFAGLSRMGRLVTGKAVLRPVGPQAMVLQQRFVVTGLRDATDAELPRVAALLTVVLVAQNGDWLALTATFGAIEA